MLSLEDVIYYKAHTMKTLIQTVEYLPSQRKSQILLSCHIIYIEKSRFQLHSTPLLDLNYLLLSCPLHLHRHLD